MTREEALNDWLPIIRQMVNGTEVYVEALEMAIKALQQEPCGDAVSRQAVDDAIYDYSRSCDVDYAQIMEFIDKLPSVTPQPCGDCVSRQAALESFGLSEKSRKYGGDHSGYETLMKYEIQDILEDLPSVTPQQNKWIPCSERLPEIHQDVILSLRSLDIEVGFRAETEPYFYCYGTNVCYIEPQDILAWMPLPEPYKQEVEE